MKVSDLVESVTSLLNEEWYDAYRDFKGEGMSDAEARAEANRMYPDEAESGSYGSRKSKQPTSNIPYNVKIDGRLWKKAGVAVQFENEAHAKAATNKPWTKGKKVELVPA